MINPIFIAIASFLILVSTNIILLNEEFLILICFIAFIWLGLNKFSTPLETYFKNYSSSVEIAVKDSLNQVSCVIKKLLELKVKYNTLIDLFVMLKTHFSNFISIALNKLPVFYKQKQCILYPKRLLIIEHIEKQSVKLISLVILKKLTKIITLKKFYSKTFNLAYFSCLHKISIRESLYKIERS